MLIQDALKESGIAYRELRRQGSYYIVQGKKFFVSNSGSLPRQTKPEYRAMQTEDWKPVTEDSPFYKLFTIEQKKHGIQYLLGEVNRLRSEIVRASTWLNEVEPTDSDFRDHIHGMIRTLNELLELL